MWYAYEASTIGLACEEAMCKGSGDPGRLPIVDDVEVCEDIPWKLVAKGAYKDACIASTLYTLISSNMSGLWARHSHGDVVWSGIGQLLHDLGDSLQDTSLGKAKAAAILPACLGYDQAGQVIASLVAYAMRTGTESGFSVVWVNMAWDWLLYGRPLSARALCGHVGSGQHGFETCAELFALLMSECTSSCFSHVVDTILSPLWWAAALRGAAMGSVVPCWRRECGLIQGVQCPECLMGGTDAEAREFWAAAWCFACGHQAQ
ncbi:hypothetical protein CDD83_6369 [Cordyceps sp. RAO-2017]|nr:hypothetical protein CDD83_6369 [Cordyceps sp. RAO-2017]